ncbi:MAG: hypothetical protein R3285_10385, partial [Kiloniellales bacterium]|nr:hypothetical protein [Kiloniellales bacterium]
QASMKLGEAMYAAQQAEADAGAEAAAGDGSGGEAPPSSEDEKVVDADFEEVDDDRRDKTA